MTTRPTFSENMFGQRRDDVGDWASAVDLAALTATVDALGIRAPAATFPASPAEGDLFYETDTDKLWAYDGTVWAQIAHVVNVACRTTRATDHPINHNTLTTIQFTGETYDTATMHDNVTLNQRIVAPRAGLYQIETFIPWQAGAYTRVIVDILLNNATVIAREAVESTLTFANQYVMSPSTTYKLAVNDYVEVRVLQTNGLAAARNVDVSNGLTAAFAATWIGEG